MSCVNAGVWNFTDIGHFFKMFTDEADIRPQLQSVI